MCDYLETGYLKKIPDQILPKIQRTKFKYVLFLKIKTAHISMKCRQSAEKTAGQNNQMQESLSHKKHEIAENWYKVYK